MKHPLSQSWHHCDLRPSGKGQDSNQSRGGHRPHRLAGGWTKGVPPKKPKDHEWPSQCHYSGRKLVYLGNGPFFGSHLCSIHLSPSINSQTVTMPDMTLGAYGIYEKCPELVLVSRGLSQDGQCPGEPFVSGPTLGLKFKIFSVIYILNFYVWSKALICSIYTYKIYHAFHMFILEFLSF